jgi:molecular chaperone GrpE
LDEHNHNHEQEPKEIKKNKILLTSEEFKALEDKAKKSDEYFDRLLRLQADFDNYKKRFEKEKIEFLK